MYINQKFIFNFTSRLVLLLSIVLSAISAKAAVSDLPSGDYKLDKSHASIVWTVSHLGLSQYVARFTDFDMDLVLDSNNLSNSKIFATVNSGSVSTENDKFDKKLTSKSWFNAPEFPKILFNSIGYIPITNKTGILTGTLEMFGIKKTVEFDVVLGGTVDNHPFIADAAGVGFEATSKIKRSEWGFTKYVPNIGDEVSIKVTAEFYTNTK